MKIAATITDAGMACNVGGPVSTTTHIIEIPDVYLPQGIRNYFQQRAETIERAKTHPRSAWYQSLTFSLIEE